MKLLSSAGRCRASSETRASHRDLGRLKTATLEKFNGDYGVHEHPTARGRGGTLTLDLALDSGD
jgi:hypothetical protein